MEDKMDLRIRKTYLALHNAFDELLSEKRFDEMTINELCDRAMIRRTTFYKHFADKYEYYAFYIKECVSTFQDRLAPDVDDGEVNAYLIHMSRETIRFLQQHNKLVQNIKNSSMFPMLLSILLEQISYDMEQVFRRARETSLEKAQIEGIAAFLAGGVTNTVFRYLRNNEPIDEEEFIRVISRFLLTNER